MAGFATCETCNQPMNPGTSCTPTHVAKVEGGPYTKRVFVGEGADWGGPCHDCNAHDGQVHHDGCDAERCPGCGGQMMGCLGDLTGLADELEANKGDEHADLIAAVLGASCGWQYLATNPPATQVEPTEDPIVKVIYKDEGDFGFITTVRRSEMAGMPPSMPWLEVLALKRDVLGKPQLGVPYDPDRQRPAGTRAEARALAAEHGADYEEV